MYAELVTRLPKSIYENQETPLEITPSPVTDMDISGIQKAPFYISLNPITVLMRLPWPRTNGRSDSIPSPARDALRPEKAQKVPARRQC